MDNQLIKKDYTGGVQRTYSTRSLHGQVVHELGKRIVSGVLGEGETLPNETELGAEFEVSRTALREGIKVLTAKGLLASRTRTGTRVRPRLEWNMLDPDILAWRLESGQTEAFLRDLYEFRRATEPMAASLAALRASDAQIAQMTRALDGMTAAGTNVQATIEPDLMFHQIILNASGNQLLASLGSLIETALSFSFQMCAPDKKLDAVPTHRAVLDAIRNRDSVAASEAMFKLLDYSRAWNEEVLQELSLNTAS
ncbi:MAG TPA: FadR/GntR family transcriptional regulator [Magnetovibrio sp.]